MNLRVSAARPVVARGASAAASLANPIVRPILCTEISRRFSPWAAALRAAGCASGVRRIWRTRLRIHYHQHCPESYVVLRMISSWGAARRRPGRLLSRRRMARAASVGAPRFAAAPWAASAPLSRALGARFLGPLRSRWAAAARLQGRTLLPALLHRLRFPYWSAPPTWRTSSCFFIRPVPSRFSAGG